MFDLAGEILTVGFSPFCWRTKMALAHKNSEFETIPWRYYDKPKIAFAGADRVPVIVDGDRPVGIRGIFADLTSKIPTSTPVTLRRHSRSCGCAFSSTTGLTRYSIRSSHACWFSIFSTISSALIEPTFRDPRKARRHDAGTFAADTAEHQALRNALRTIACDASRAAVHRWRVAAHSDYIIFRQPAMGSIDRQNSPARNQRSIEGWRERLSAEFGGLAAQGARLLVNLIAEA